MALLVALLWVALLVEFDPEEELLVEFDPEEELLVEFDPLS